MSDNDNIIDVEAIEIIERDEPLAIEPAMSTHEDSQPLEPDRITRSNGQTYEAKPGRTADGRSLNSAAVAEHDAQLAANEERRCVATNSRGERCRKFAIYGGTVCKSHGGATRRVVDKARIRVQMAGDRLMGKLIDVAFDDTKPPDTQLRAIRDALDRAGLKPPSEVVLSQGEPRAYETVFDTIGGAPSESLEESIDYGQNDSPAPAYNPIDDAPEAEAGEDSAQSAADEQASHSSDPEPPPPSRPRENARDRPRQPPVRHITGEAAIYLANAANREIGALPPLRELESPHRRYRRP
ncbi:hypothetical protein ACQ856_03495 [Mycolicibacterium psychrotolerans]|uniref:hypothetical protein n=1 Tax=Mycolicibacterium psychrotolerans TaxID=216929 RepID=UPI003D67C8F0